MSGLTMDDDDSEEDVNSLLNMIGGAKKEEERKKEKPHTTPSPGSPSNEPSDSGNLSAKTKSKIFIGKMIA